MAKDSVPLALAAEEPVQARDEFQALIYSNGNLRGVESTVCLDLDPVFSRYGLPPGTEGIGSGGDGFTIDYPEYTFHRARNGYL